MIHFTCRRHHFAIAALVLIAACSKGDGPPAGAMPGALTKPIDQYTGDEFDALVKSLKYTGKHEKERKCKNSPECSGTKKVKVSVEAVATQDSVGSSNVPQYGVVYIRAINDGDAEEARYSLAPGKMFEYYLIVSADSTGGMQWRLEQLDTTPKARAHKQVGTGAFEGCNHTWVAGAQANFKTCADSSTASVGGRTVRLGLAMQFDEDPMWSACASGCCIAR